MKRCGARGDARALYKNSWFAKAVERFPTPGCDQGPSSPKRGAPRKGDAGASIAGARLFSFFPHKHFLLNGGHSRLITEL